MRRLWWCWWRVQNTSSWKRLKHSWDVASGRPGRPSTKANRDKNKTFRIWIHVCFEQEVHYQMAKAGKEVKCKEHTWLGRAATPLSSRRSRGPSSSRVSAVQLEGLLKVKNPASACEAAPTPTGSATYPKVLMTSWMRSVLLCWGMWRQDAMACRLNGTTWGSIRARTEGFTSHKSRPSLDTSALVRSVKFFRWKVTASHRWVILHLCVWIFSNVETSNFIWFSCDRLCDTVLALKRIYSQ